MVAGLFFVLPQNQYVDLCICSTPIVFVQYMGSVNMWIAVIIVDWPCQRTRRGAPIFSPLSRICSRRRPRHRLLVLAVSLGIGRPSANRADSKGCLSIMKALGKSRQAILLCSLICGGAYLLAWVVMHFLVPRCSESRCKN